ncbi:MAG: hypothetical protein Ta2A_10520 [Treponemataceae bacterium]|nr:MAG: hypothetical protein Ta2A_10520 [Treponemataceae bacterium]
MGLIAIILGIIGTLPVIRFFVLLVGLLVLSLLSVLGLATSAPAFFVGG